MSYFEKGRMHIMPVVFGPGGTPRETEDGSRYIYKQQEGTTVISHKIVYETEAALLEKLLPDKFRLTEPYVILSFNELRNIGWLAGNGYDLIQIEIPCCFDGENGKVEGTLMPVVWENHADPILTGREQLGWNKIFADMKKNMNEDGIVKVTASSWGFQFLEIILDPNKGIQSPDEFKAVISNPNRQGMLHYKYMPRTGGNFDVADVEYITLSPAKWNPPEDYDGTKIPKPISNTCFGELKWHRSEWKQMPTQYHIVQKLHDLSIKRFIGASITKFHAPNDRKDQIIIR